MPPLTIPIVCADPIFGCGSHLETSRTRRSTFNAALVLLRQSTGPSIFSTPFAASA